MNHKDCNCSEPGPLGIRVRVYAHHLGTSGGVYGNGADVVEAVANCKEEMRQHRQPLRESQLVAVRLSEDGGVIFDITRPRRWSLVVEVDRPPPVAGRRALVKPDPYRFGR